MTSTSTTPTPAPPTANGRLGYGCHPVPAVLDDEGNQLPIPEGGGPSSTTDPQQTVSQAYNTVLLPMDDGNWHVTVYCPAALDASLLDKDANELDPDQVKAGDEAYTVISATGYGTVSIPAGPWRSWSAGRSPSGR